MVHKILKYATVVLSIVCCCFFLCTGVFAAAKHGTRCTTTVSYEPALLFKIWSLVDGTEKLIFDNFSSSTPTSTISVNHLVDANNVRFKVENHSNKFIKATVIPVHPDGAHLYSLLNEENQEFASGQIATASIPPQNAATNHSELTPTFHIQSLFANTPISLKIHVETIQSPYTTLEYIESTGTQYIDTGIKATNKTNTACAYKFTNTTQSGTVFGGRTTDSTATSKSYQYHGVGSTQTMQVMYNNFYNGSLSTYDTNTHFVELLNNVLYLDGNIIQNLPTSTYQTQYNVYLFATNTANMIQFPAKLQIFSCKFWENDVLVRDYIPVKNSSNIAGLYDLVNNTFCPSATATNFVAGPVVNSPPAGYTMLEYLEGTGTQYINTNYFSNISTDAIEIKYQITDSALNVQLAGFGRDENHHQFYYNYTNGSHNEFIMQYRPGPEAVYAYKRKTVYSPTDEEIHIIKRDRLTVYLNNVYRGSLSPSGAVTHTTATMPMGLFTKIINSDGTGETPAKAKIYFCKIWNNDILVRDFVPVKNSSNIAGLYDLTTGIFYPSASETNFVAGPAL